MGWCVWVCVGGGNLLVFSLLARAIHCVGSRCRRCDVDGVCGLFEALLLKAARVGRFNLGNEVGVGSFASLWVRFEAGIPCFSWSLPGFG